MDLIHIYQSIFFHYFTFFSTCSKRRRPAFFVFRKKSATVASTTGRPGSSEVSMNPLTRWDVSLIPANGIFLTIKLKTKTKNAQRVEND